MKIVPRPEQSCQTSSPAAFQTETLPKKGPRGALLVGGSPGRSWSLGRGKSALLELPRRKNQEMWANCRNPELLWRPAAAELRSAWTDECVRPYATRTDECVRPYAITDCLLAEP